MKGSGGVGIHQVLVSAAPGDAITNLALGTRRLLRRVGPSEIYAYHVAPELHDDVLPLTCVPHPARPQPVDLPRVDRSVGSARVLDGAGRTARARVPQRDAGPVLRALRSRVRGSPRSRAARGRTPARTRGVRDRRLRVQRARAGGDGVSRRAGRAACRQPAAPLDGGATRVDTPSSRESRRTDRCCRSAS